MLLLMSTFQSCMHTCMCTHTHSLTQVADMYNIAHTKVYMHYLMSLCLQDQASCQLYPPSSLFLRISSPYKLQDMYRYIIVFPICVGGGGRLSPEWPLWGSADAGSSLCSLLLPAPSSAAVL